MEISNLQINKSVLFCLVVGIPTKPEGAGMKETAENSIDDLSHFQCLEKEKRFCRLQTIEEFADRTNRFSKDDCLGIKYNTKTSLDNKVLDSIISSQATERGDNSIPTNPVQSQDSEYVSLNFQMLRRSKPDGGIIYRQRKPNCYYGKKEDDSNKLVPRQRVRSTGLRRTLGQDEAGISETPVFFSSIGEWTIVDLNLNMFEKEEAKRVFYLRMKRASYKEEEPEAFGCTIL